MPVVTPDQDRLLQTSRAWAKALGSRNVEKIVSFWSEDAIVMPPDQPALVGKSAIRQYVAQSLATPGFSVTWDPELAVVSEGGDQGYMVEASRFTFPDSAGVLATRYGKTVTVWRRTPGGDWECVIDIWNGNPSQGVLPTG
ncbi:MAG: DUF4440 domain-containing protein [Thermoplasmata archaeon]|nr:DUF4440 domain-containing protein [Thermoplasmata archaeon]